VVAIPAELDIRQLVKFQSNFLRLKDLFLKEYTNVDSFI
jgi:hypothetical protein